MAGWGGGGEVVCFVIVSFPGYSDASIPVRNFDHRIEEVGAGCFVLHWFEKCALYIVICFLFLLLTFLGYRIYL